MLSAKRHEPRSPFPRLPDAFKARYGVGDLTLRPFGLRETDLEVDFTVRPRPLLVTQILECCTTAAEREKVDPSFFWDLTVGKRIECLLTIATSGGRSGVTLQLRCPNEACGQQSELDISVEELAGLQNPTREAERFPIRRGEERLFIRRPTGSDQLAWLTGRFASEDEAVRSMIRTLISVDEQGTSVL